MQGDAVLDKEYVLGFLSRELEGKYVSEYVIDTYFDGYGAICSRIAIQFQLSVLGPNNSGVRIEDLLKRVGEELTDAEIRKVSVDYDYREELAADMMPLVFVPTKDSGMITIECAEAQ